MKLLAVALLALLAGVSTAQRTVKIPTTYNVLARSGEDKLKTKDGWVMGTFYDINYKPIYFENNGTIAVSHTPDWTTLLKVSEADDVTLRAWGAARSISLAWLSTCNSR